MEHVTTNAQRRVLRIDPDAVELEPMELDPAAFQSPLPVQHYVSIFDDEEVGLTVGIWDTTTMQEAFGPYPGDEFITVLDGDFSIVDGHGQAVTGRAGQSATFHDGVPVSWTQVGYLRKIYLVLEADEDIKPEGTHAADCTQALDSDRAIDAVTDADGVRREQVYRNLSGTMTVTQCAFPEMTVPQSASPVFRLVRVLAGEIVVTGSSGDVETFESSAHFFVPKGAESSWQIAEGTAAYVVDITV